MADESTPVRTTNDYAINAGKNMENHTLTRAGLGSFVRQGVPDIPTFRTRQAAYRYAAYLIELAGHNLPDEEGCSGHTFEEVRAALIELGVK